VKQREFAKPHAGLFHQETIRKDREELDEESYADGAIFRHFCYWFWSCVGASKGESN
jgi:hypothetical protein